jgi:hypothetical protein
MSCPADYSAGADRLLSLIYELLDAHVDTVELASDTNAFSYVVDPCAEDVRPLRWEAHLDYLRALQRQGHEILAHTDLIAPPSSAGAGWR